MFNNRVFYNNAPETFSFGSLDKGDVFCLPSSSPNRHVYMRSSYGHVPISICLNTGQVFAPHSDERVVRVPSGTRVSIVVDGED